MTVSAFLLTTTRSMRMNSVEPTLRLINRPPVPPQPGHRIPRKSRPSTHHIPRRRRLDRIVRLPADVLRGAEDQLQLAAVIGAAAGVEAEVRPVAEVAVAPDGDAVFGPVGGFDLGGAGEAGEVEGVPLGFGQVAAGGEGVDFVAAGFVVGVSEEVWLGVGRGGVSRV